MAKLRGLNLEWWLSIGIVGAVVVTIGVVVVVRAADSHAKTDLERLADDAWSGRGCYDVARRPDPRLTARWPTATDTATVFCETSKEDPFPNWVLQYVRFADPAALRAAVARRKPKARACVFGSAMVVDFDLPSFVGLCAKRHGTILR